MREWGEVLEEAEALTQEGADVVILAYGLTGLSNRDIWLGDQRG